MSHKDFTAVSVTAEQWLPIRDVSIAGLVPYLLRLRREGYTLVGLEQTRGAVDVNAFEFPRRTALVLQVRDEHHRRRGAEGADTAVHEHE